MSDTVIRVEGLGKKYIIGHESQRDPAGTLRDAIVRACSGFAQTIRQTARGRAIVAGDTTEEFWALKDVSFEVRRGEVLGIIGPNGAGKSTLLKILSRITDPSEGRVEIRGRVASLLEVGTGFHPELTGRENVYLNGAILGMTRGEIRRKFDEIVAFAGVERFLDTPVKRYSSGMYVRLAFAVAAHLESEILVVDEVLAVGDAEFQKKCLGKMSEVAGLGRTVLLVSHNLAVVRRLCTVALLLEQGRLSESGQPAHTIGRYLDPVERRSLTVFDLSGCKRAGAGRVRLERLEFVGHEPGAPLRVFDEMGFSFRLTATSPDDMTVASVWVLFRSMLGDDVLMIMQKDSTERLPAARSAEMGLSTRNILAPGRYSISCGVLGHGREIWDWVDSAAFLEVAPGISGAGVYDSRLGLVTVKGEWRIAAASH